MKIKMKELQKTANALLKIKEEKMNSMAAFKVAMLAKEIDELLTFYQERTAKIFEEYVEKTADGHFAVLEDQITFKKDSEDKFFKEMDELNEMEVDISDRKIPLSSLSKVEMDFTVMSALLSFIDEEK